MSEVRIIEVKDFKPKKCDLTGKEMEEYNKTVRKFNKAFKEICKNLDEIRSFEDKHHIRWGENKQMIADAYCLMLQLTSSGGTGNHVSKLVYEKKENGTEIVYPVLADGDSNWYTIDTTGGSGIAMVSDITNQFVRKAWW